MEVGSVGAEPIQVILYAENRLKPIPKPRVADGVISGWDLDAPLLRVCQNSGFVDWFKSVAARERN